MSVVLVTGGSGFVGSHCILQLLSSGHRVRTTVRNLQREPDVRGMLKQAGSDAQDRLSFVAADLQNDAGWSEAAAGCDYVLHVASPFPPSVPKHEDELIVPAREGTLRVLRAARDAGVKRVVMTSSFAAIGYGHEQRTTPFDETDWTNLDDADVSAYAKSKTLAERAAWDFIATEGNGLELCVINPVLVLGPIRTSDMSPSILLVQRLMNGSLPACPRLHFGIVDVRDVADLHLRAMTHPAAKGERFLAIADNVLSMHDVAMVLRNRMGTDARKVPTRQLPNWLMRVVALFDPAARLILPELGKKKSATNEKARRLLQWSPRTSEDAIVATAQSLLDLGLLKSAAKAA